MSMTFDFRGRSAVVTGGAQGIGFEIARGFLAAGARVAVWDFSAAAMTSAAAELSQWRERVTFEQVDVGDLASCTAAAARLTDPVHVLINNAGITRDKSIAKLTSDDFTDVIRINLTGAFNTVKSLLERFDANDTEKRVINMSSIVGLYGNFGQTNYAAAKAGLIGMTKTLARELGRKGFTVNAVAPGFIDTRMAAAVPKDVLDALVAKVPRGRLGRTTDIAAACFYLASAEAGYVNGTVLNVDGGLVL